MFIKSFYLHDSIKNYTVPEIQFDKLNVLVGTSGCGKTTIIKGFESLVEIANGESKPGLSWVIEFVDNDNRKVVWQGIFDKSKNRDTKGYISTDLLSEEIKVDGQLLLRKANSKTALEGIVLPVMDKSKSNLYLLREDERFYAIFSAMVSLIIVLNDSEEQTRNDVIYRIPKGFAEMVEDFFNKNQFESINELHQHSSVMDSRFKLLLASRIDSKQFNEFLFIYTSIFPNVESVQLHTFSEKENDDAEFLVISLVMDNGKVIEQKDISSGMFKTLMLLSDLMFSSKNTVLLIDELENSIGINCLPDIISEIKSAQFQVIVTTHHPKIINDIPPKYWKIIHRNGDEILVDDAKAISESKSHHDPQTNCRQTQIITKGPL